MLLKNDMLQALISPVSGGGGLLQKGLNVAQNLGGQAGLDQAQGDNSFQAEMLSNMLQSRFMQGANPLGADQAMAGDMASSLENTLFQDAMLLDALVTLSRVSDTQNAEHNGFSLQGLGQSAGPSAFQRAIKAFAAADHAGGAQEADGRENFIRFPEPPETANQPEAALRSDAVQQAENQEQDPSVIRRPVQPPQSPDGVEAAPDREKAPPVESDPKPPESRPAETAVAQNEPPVTGELSSRFESARHGVAEIGFDRMGGTSYGSYQIASKVGSMDRFLDFLEKEAPQWASRLREAGPANTGSAQGAMPDEWRAIASESPEKFEKLQHQFVTRTHYDTALGKIHSATGLDLSGLPNAVQEVLFSTAVQHGPTGAARIFERALNAFPGGKMLNTALNSVIDAVYDERKEQFSGSTPIVRRSVQNRLENEKQVALSMLQADESQA